MMFLVCIAMVLGVGLGKLSPMFMLFNSSSSNSPN